LSMVLRILVMKDGSMPLLAILVITFCEAWFSL
jgi:hypothetical protein